MDNELKEQYKSDIMDLIKKNRNGEISFIEIEGEINYRAGDNYLMLNSIRKGYKNLILWVNFDLEIVKAIEELFAEDILEIRPSSAPVYCFRMYFCRRLRKERFDPNFLYDDDGLKFPVAKKVNHAYVRPRWLPTIISLKGESKLSIHKRKSIASH